MERFNHNSGFNSMADFGHTNKHLSKEQIIGKLDKILDKYTTSSISFSNDMVRIIKQLRRRRKEFEATRFFVLVVGPVKSGKSTLVNIFARKYVSPTAYKECTALPTIIGKSSGEHLNKIIQYFPTNEYCSDEAKKETFDYIVDVIREVEDNAILEDRVEKNISDLTIENVKNIITLFYDEGDKKEELVVSLGVEGGGFIDDEIMLIDMPGLDGSLKHQDNTLVYSNMAQRADAVFFVQSTTSAINKASIDFLNTLFKEKKGKVPVWLIHNIHDSQYFLKDDDKKNADIKEQVQIGKRRVQEGFGITRFTDVVLNLGKIYTAINERERIKDENKEEVIYIYEEYKKFESDLIYKLKSERQKIKDEINIGKAIDAINDSLNAINYVIDGLKQDLDNIHNNIAKTRLLSGMIDAIQIYDSGFLTCYDNLLISENIRTSWEVKIEDLFNGEARRCSEKIKGKDLNERIDTITHKCLDAMPINNGTQFRIKLINSLCKEISSSFETTVDEIENILSELFEGEKIYIKNDISQLATTILKTSVRDIIPYRVDEKCGLGNIFNKKYNKTEQREYLDIAKSDVIDIIPAKLEEYKIIIKDDFKSIRDEYISMIKNTINEYSIEYEKKQLLIIENINSRINLLNNFMNDLKF